MQHPKRVEAIMRRSFCFIVEVLFVSGNGNGFSRKWDCGRKTAGTYVFYVLLNKFIYNKS